MTVARIFAHSVELLRHETTYKWSGRKSVTVFDSTIVLTSSLVPAPFHCRRTWGRNPLANLRSAAPTLSRAEHGELVKALRAVEAKALLEKHPDTEP